MRTNSVLVAALAAAATVVSAAEGQRPKIYFPRHLKRQYSNVSITTESPVSQSTPFGSTPETTKRDSISDLLASLDKPTFTDKPTFVISSSDASNSADTTPDNFRGSTGFRDSTSGSDSGVTTIIVESTVVVPPSADATPVSSVGAPVFASAPSDSPSDVSAGVASTGGIPATIVLPTSSDPAVAESASPTDTATDALDPTASAAPTPTSDAASSDVASPSADPTSSDLFSSAESSVEPTSSTGILLAPTGIVTSTSDPSPTLSDPLAPISSILSSVISEVTSAILPSANVTDTAAPVPTTTTPTSEDPSSPSADPSSPSVEPTATVAPTASAEPTDPSASASPTAPETEQPSVTATQDPTTAAPEPTSSDIGISLSLTLFPGTGSSTVVDTTPPASEPTGEPTTAVVPPPVTNATDTSIPTSAPPASESTVTPIDPTTTPEPTVTGVQPTDPPVSGNATVTEPSQTLSTPETTAPGTTISDITVPPTTEPTLLPTGSAILPNVTSSDNTTIPETTTELPPPPPPTTASSPTSIETTAGGVTSIAATATLTGANTNTWLPTTIVVDQPPTGTTTQNLAPTSATALPSALPKAITPDSGNTDTPVDTTIIGIGFKYTLNYEFVVGNSKAAAQIFEYLPTAVRNTGDFPAEKVILKKLVPLDTVGTLGYWTTIALMTYPSNMIDQLRLDVRTPNSPLYNEGSEIVTNLTAQINAAIDIIYGLGLNDDGTTASGAGSPAATSSGGAQSDPFGNTSSGDGTSKPGQSGTTAGIALGVIGVAGAYGAAMFIIARRYKRKRQAHRRASSITDPSEMRSAAGSPHFMGGALLSREFSSYGGVAGGRNSHGTQGTQGSGRSGANNSARTAYISGPMSAENSLGWN